MPDGVSIGTMICHSPYTPKDEMDEARYRCGTMTPQTECDDYSWWDGTLEFANVELEGDEICLHRGGIVHPTEYSPWGKSCTFGCWSCGCDDQSTDTYGYAEEICGDAAIETSVASYWTPYEVNCYTCPTKYCCYYNASNGEYFSNSSYGIEEGESCEYYDNANPDISFQWYTYDYDDITTACASTWCCDLSTDHGVGWGGSVYMAGSNGHSLECASGSTPTDRATAFANCNEESYCCDGYGSYEPTMQEKEGEGAGWMYCREGTTLGPLSLEEAENFCKTGWCCYDETETVFEATWDDEEERYRCLYDDEDLGPPQYDNKWSALDGCLWPRYCCDYDSNGGSYEAWVDRGKEIRVCTEGDDIFLEEEEAHKNCTWDKYCCYADGTTSEGTWDTREWKFTCDDDRVYTNGPSHVNGSKMNLSGANQPNATSWAETEGNCGVEWKYCCHSDEYSKYTYTAAIVNWVGECEEGDRAYNSLEEASKECTEGLFCCGNYCEVEEASYHADGTAYCPNAGQSPITWSQRDTCKIGVEEDGYCCEQEENEYYKAEFGEDCKWKCRDGRVTKIHTVSDAETMCGAWYCCDGSGGTKPIVYGQDCDNHAGSRRLRNSFESLCSQNLCCDGDPNEGCRNTDIYYPNECEDGRKPRPNTQTCEQPKEKYWCCTVEGYTSCGTQCVNEGACEGCEGKDTYSSASEARNACAHDIYCCDGEGGYGIVSGKIALAADGVTYRCPDGGTAHEDETSAYDDCKVSYCCELDGSGSMVKPREGCPSNTIEAEDGDCEMGMCYYCGDEGGVRSYMYPGSGICQSYDEVYSSCIADGWCGEDGAEGSIFGCCNLSGGHTEADWVPNGEYDSQGNACYEVRCSSGTPYYSGQQCALAEAQYPNCSLGDCDDYCYETGGGGNCVGATLVQDPGWNYHFGGMTCTWYYDDGSTQTQSLGAWGGYDEGPSVWSVNAGWLCPPPGTRYVVK